MMDLHDKIIPLILYTIIYWSSHVKIVSGEFNAACGESQTVDIGDVFTFDEDMMRASTKNIRTGHMTPPHVPVDNNLDSPAPYGGPEPPLQAPGAVPFVQHQPFRQVPNLPQLPPPQMPLQMPGTFGGNQNEVVGSDAHPLQDAQRFHKKDEFKWLRGVKKILPGGVMPPLPSIVESPPKVVKVKEDIVAKSPARDSKVVKYKDYTANKGQRLTHDRRNKLPMYAQHMMDHQKSKNIRPHEPVNNPIASISNKDLLGFLEPKKLDQLRHLLNSAPRNRLKRSLPGHGVNKFGPRHSKSEATICSRTFVKAPNCRQLVVTIQQWSDGVKNCNLEGLTVSGGENGPDTLCGPNGNPHSVYITGNKGTISHFRNSVRGELRFKGTVSCE